MTGTSAWNESRLRLDEHQLPIAQAHAIPLAHRGLTLVRHVAYAAIVHLDGDLVDLVAVVRLDLVADELAAKRPDHRQRGFPRATAELVADHAAHHRAADGGGVLFPVGGLAYFNLLHAPAVRAFASLGLGGGVADVSA